MQGFIQGFLEGNCLDDLRPVGERLYKYLVKGVTTNNEGATQEFNYPSGMNCDLCTNAVSN